MKPELLMPASSPEVFYTAIRYGADAVYIGGEAFGLRAKSRNFSLQEMKQCIPYAHSKGVRVYVTANILAHNRDLEAFDAYAGELAQIRPDALIISDPGIFMRAKRIWPDAEIHISTQANNINYDTFRFWYDLGAKRVVAGRELSLAEIREIRAHIPKEMEIEAFVHGAMCISYSGRCLLSAALTGREANQGLCTHPCRWEYAIVEASRPGCYMPVEENERGTFIFNAKDLCMIEHIPELIDAGINSFKVEGRMKNALYAATIARAYRRAIDDCMADPGLYEKKRDWYRGETLKCTRRPDGTGFFFGRPGAEGITPEAGTYIKEYRYLGIVDRVMPDGMCGLRQKNKFSVGDTVEVMKPDGTDLFCRVTRMTDDQGNAVTSCPHPQQYFYADLGAAAEPGDVLRMEDP